MQTGKSFGFSIEYERADAFLNFFVEYYYGGALSSEK
jgi:hypothetical protein